MCLQSTKSTFNCDYTECSMAAVAFIMWTISLLPRCGHVITLMYGRTLTIFTITLGNVNTPILAKHERRCVCVLDVRNKLIHMACTFFIIF